MDKLNLTENDFRLQNHGLAVILHPLNDAAGDWIYEHLDNVEWHGGGVIIQGNQVFDALAMIKADGLNVEGVS